MDHAGATRVAAWIGQAVAVVFAGLGLFGHQPMLLLIAVFVFLGAEAETQVAQVRAGLAGIPVRDAMITRFSTLSESDTLAAATDLLLAGSQTDFPVLSGDRIVGVLPRADLVRALAERGPGARVAEVMRPGCEPVADTERLAQVFERMQASGCPLVPVVRQGRLVGLVTPENVGEFLMIRSALAHPAKAPEGGGDPTPAR
jgi:CBS domain-containing protein